MQRQRQVTAQRQRLLCNVPCAAWAATSPRRSASCCRLTAPAASGRAPSWSTWAALPGPPGEAHTLHTAAAHHLCGMRPAPSALRPPAVPLYCWAGTNSAAAKLSDPSHVRACLPCRTYGVEPTQVRQGALTARAEHVLQERCSPGGSCCLPFPTATCVLGCCPAPPAHSCSPVRSMGWPWCQRRCGARASSSASSAA